MKYTEYRRREVTKAIAETQDGQLKERNGEITDPINMILVNAIENNEDTEDTETDIRYAISELTRALNVLQTING